MDISDLVARNMRPERFTVHAQGKVTPSQSDAIDTFASKHGLTRSTAVRVLLTIALKQVAADE